MFETLVGNEPIKRYLTSALQEGKVPHTLLFAGIEGIGKALFAKELAKALLQTEKDLHPDLYLIHPEGKIGMHSIDRLRKMMEATHTAPFEAKAKVFLLFEAHRMQPAAANALLKTLEEPTAGTYFFLLSHAPSEILPTILSRSTLLRFQRLKTEEIAAFLKKEGLSESQDTLSHGSIGQALRFAKRDFAEEELFPLLAKKHSFLEEALILERVEKLLEDEDPIQQSEKVEHLLASILMWYRDQHILKNQWNTPLFFPKAPRCQKELPPLDKLAERLDEIKRSLAKNLKISHLLQSFLDL